MVVFRTHHDITIRGCDFFRQELKLSGCFALRVSKVRFEYETKIKIQRIDQLSTEISPCEAGLYASFGDSQAKPGRVGG